MCLGRVLVVSGLQEVVRQQLRQLLRQQEAPLSARALGGGYTGQDGRI